MEDTISVNSQHKYFETNYDKEFTINNYRFLLVEKELNLSGTIPDGVMGLGIDTEGNINNSFVYSLYKQNKIKEASFSFYLASTRDTSRLYFGDILENKYIQQFLGASTHFCNVPYYSHYWQCKVDNGVTLYHKGSALHFNTNANVIFDTGSSYTIIPSEDFLTIMSYYKSLGEQCKLNTIYQMQCMCSSPEQFDVIQMKFSSGAQYNITLNEMIDYYPYERYQCHFQIIVDVFGLNIWLLGDSALRATLITFNMNTKQIKWVQTKNRFDEMQLADSAMVNAHDKLFASFNWMNWLIYITIALCIIGIVYYFIR